MYKLNEKAASLTAYQPVDAGNCVRLDANESFLNMPPEILGRALAHITAADFNRYPDPAAGELCRAFAAYYGLDPAGVVAGNGSDELISVIFQAFLLGGQAFATLEPDFSMYAHAGKLCEARHVAIRKGKDFSIDVEEVIRICTQEDVKLLIFSNPCNPTSIVLGREKVRRLVSAVEALVVLDEAYMDFADESLLDEVGKYDNLIILRTCSKAIGMAALRLGFAVAGEKLAGVLRAAKSPYNVNAVSQLMGAAMLRDRSALEERLEQILASRWELLAGLEALLVKRPGAFVVLPCQANFAALVMEEPAAAQQKLLSQGVAVRCTGGLLRVTCGAPEENRLFLEKFEKVLEEMP